MAKPETIKIYEVEYVRKDSVSDIKGDVKIVVLQRGWIVVGRFKRNGSACSLSQASVIRNWGTTKGLGEIASNGPTPSTKLDKCYGIVEFDYLTTVLTLDCEELKWKNSL